MTGKSTGRRIKDTGYVEHRLGRTWYMRVGTGGRTPVIALHGGPGFPHDYLTRLEPVSETRPIVFYDQLGCGRSGEPKRNSGWSVSAFVDELEALRTALGIRRFHLLGHSWGTMLGIEYYLRFPRRVSSLVFSSPCLSAKEWAADAERLRTRMGTRWQRSARRLEKKDATSGPEYAGLKDAYARRFIFRTKVPPLEMRLALAGFNFPVYSRLWGPSEFCPTGTLAHFDRTEELRKIRVPSLFTCGRFDEATPRATALYRSLAPGGRLHVFKKSAHMMVLEEPRETIRVLNRFWNRSEA